MTLAELLPDGTSAIVRDGRGRLHDGAPLPVTPGGQLAVALRDRCPVVRRGLRRRGRVRVADCLRERGLRSGIAVPIARVDGAPYGILAVHWHAPRQIDAGQVRVVEAMAFVIGAALQREHVEAEISRSAMHDPVTQLPNRLLFEDRLGQALRRTGDAPCTVALLAQPSRARQRDARPPRRR